MYNNNTLVHTNIGLLLLSLDGKTRRKTEEAAVTSMDSYFTGGVVGKVNFVRTTTQMQYYLYKVFFFNNRVAQNGGKKA